MKTIIAGSRDLTDLALVNRAVFESGFHITEVVSGKAKGIDSTGEEWAAVNGVPVHPMPADWYVDGIFDPRAGFERNQSMANYADALVYVWDGVSPGTEDMITRAKKRGLRVYGINLKEEAEKKARKTVNLKAFYTE